MPDLAEQLIAKIKDGLSTTTATLANPNPADIHVGEDIPQHRDDSDELEAYIWLQFSGQEIDSESYAFPAKIETTFFDIEVVSFDIVRCRELTGFVKTILRSGGIWPANLAGGDANNPPVQFVDVDDHDDDYIVRNVDDDKRNQIGALAASLHH
jgi:hypothetical protein